jgi:type I restriction enzyme M protein
MAYVQRFSPEAREIFDHFKFEEFVDRLDAANILYPVVQRFAATDLSPERLDNFTMGVVFEELIRKFAEDSNETAGEHFTPRDVVHLTTSLVFTDQQRRLKPGAIVRIYDPAAGTGGFLSESEAYIKQISADVDVSLHGQELNPESYAICKADMLIKGQSIDNVKLGNTLSDDRHAGERYDFLLANPPFGVDWKAVRREVEREHTQRGHDGRFGPGLPRVSDGSLLFLLHLVAKMDDSAAKHDQGPARIGIILNGSPLFTGGAGSGESEIRRYLLEHDLVEAIVALPTDMFYNTGIATYVWILSNRKPDKRRGKVQLINAAEHYSKMRKSLGAKRRWLDDAQIDTIVRLYGDFAEGDESRIFDTQTFGYRRITVERPLKLNFQASDERLARLKAERAIEKLDESEQQQIEAACRRLDPDTVYTNREKFTADLDAALKEQGLKPRAPIRKAILAALSERDENADVCTDKHGNPEPDTDLRDHENVPLGEDVHDYFEREVKPHVADLPAPRPRKGQYCAYVLKCSDGSFYKGQTDNLPRRLEEHEKGNVSWTAKNLPVELIHWEVFPTREEAVAREKELKTGYGRKWIQREYQAGRLKAASRQAGAWIDENKRDPHDGEIGIVGYEIPFNRHFYQFVPPRPLEEIDADLKACTDRIKRMIEEISV